MQIMNARTVFFLIVALIVTGFWGGVISSHFNKSDKPARALFWVSPAGKLEDLFEALHDLSDVPEVIRLSAEHEVDFLPMEAND